MEKLVRGLGNLKGVTLRASYIAKGAVVNLGHVKTQDPPVGARESSRNSVHRQEEEEHETARARVPGAKKEQRWRVLNVWHA